ncbi:MAG: flagellar assembly protein FliH [Pseudohongiellaceae bacterium]|jgi:flagellar assembly protein FliH
MEQHPFDLNRRLSAAKLAELDVELWQPPAIGGGEHLVYAKAKPAGKLPEEPDLAEIARREGYDTGLKKGGEEGFSQGKQEGLLSGKAEAVALAQQEMQPKLKQLNQLLTTLSHSLNEEDYNLEKTLFDLVKVIAVSVIRKELELSPGSLMKVVKETIAALPHSRDNIKIILHPADKAFAEAAITEGGENWRVVADQEMTRGGCKIETDQSAANASIEHRINAVLDQIYEQHAISPKLGEPGFEAAPEPAVVINHTSAGVVESDLPPSQAVDFGGPV